MFSRPKFQGSWAYALGLIATSPFAAAGPCDLYSSGGTPCVAAHSTTRALYSAYNGNLYQVQRTSDSTTKNITPLSAGGVANAATQDTFCAGTTCVISIIYDQSGRGNHLTQAPPGDFQGPEVNGYDNLASAIGAPVTLNGQKAYGVFVSPGTGYRNNAASGTATGDAAEGMYAVLDGTHYNGVCCFDYGNAEVDSSDTGNGHMEAIYFGDSTNYGYGAGSGPWIMADLENGLFSGSDARLNSGDPTLTNRFLTTVIKGGANKWAIRGANAASGSLSTYYSGARPAKSIAGTGGYDPMKKEGAIILGIGGDNSHGAQGTFYEGVMTTGYPTDDVEASVQANIVAAKYATTSLNSGTTLSVGSKYSLRATTSGYDTKYIAHDGSTISLQVVTSSSTTALKQQASWKVVAGLGNSNCISFESVDTPGSYIRHAQFVLELSADDGTKLMHEDATFCYQAGLNGQGNSIRAWSYPTHYFRHYTGLLYAARQGGVNAFDATASFNDDVSFVSSSSFA